ncbi:MAG: hypothetical protein KA419_02945 [Acidobacteria bacterium]|nr:hypothetical protein [Acidobacteriota bacterium]
MERASNPASRHSADRERAGCGCALSRAVLFLLLLAFVPLTEAGAAKLLILGLDRNLEDTADNTYSSAPVLQSLLAGLGQADVTLVRVAMNDHATLAAFDYSPYRAVFVCNAMNVFTPYSHVFNAAEGQRLVDYLNTGGSVYMEGGDVWYQDPAVNGAFNFRPAFGVNSAAQATDSLYRIKGKTGTFFAGFQFDFSSTHGGFRDLVTGAGSALTVMENHTNASPPAVTGAWVAFDGPVYKCIASCIRFSGLQDGAGGNTRSALLARVLDFLGVTNPARSYYCPHVYTGAAWWTRLSVVNLGLTDYPLTLTLYNPSGQVVDTRTVSSLAPKAQYSAAMDELFGPGIAEQDLWLLVSTRSPIKGALEFGTRDGLSQTGLPLSETAFASAVFPYVYMNQDTVSSYYTGITLINTENVTATVTLRAYNEDNTLVATTDPPINIPPKGKYVRLINQVFTGLPDPSVIRMIIASTTVNSLVGFELFGKWGEMGLAGLPAVQRTPPARDLAAPEGPRGPDETVYLYYNELPPSESYYTGVTFSNFGSQPATLTAELLNGIGVVLASKEWTAVQPLQQITRSVWDAVNTAPRSDAARLRVRAEVPMVGFELLLAGSGTTYRFDGLPAVSSGSGRVVFSVVPAAATFDLRVRISNLHYQSNGVTLEVYDAQGSSLGAYPTELPYAGKYDLALSSLFPGVLNSIAWLEVRGTGTLDASLFYPALDQTRLGVVAGQPWE